jgi:hypothetical protein
MGLLEIFDVLRIVRHPAKHRTRESGQATAERAWDERLCESTSQTRSRNWALFLFQIEGASGCNWVGRAFFITCGRRDVCLQQVSSSDTPCLSCLAAGVVGVHAARGATGRRLGTGSSFRMLQPRGCVAGCVASRELLGMPSARSWVVRDLLWA